MKVRTRFAPSPTGYLHIGSLRTALFAYLFARHNQGDFVLRIEDTDQARFVEGAIQKIISTMTEVGLDYDEGVVDDNGQIGSKGEYGPYVQSKRLDIYKEHAEQLIKSGHAYYCFCDEKRLQELRKEQEALKKPSQYDRKCRNLSADEIKANLEKGLPHVVRQAVPLDGQTVVKDLVYREIVWENKALDDQILLKSDGFPTYHLAVVVDDHLMNITHVIRGEEWIPSTPKHVLLYKAFGWTATSFAHLPLLLNKDRSKLSKRQGDVAVEDYLQKGYLKEALLNFVALLGWNPKTDKEIFTLYELVAEFDFAKVNRAGAVLDTEKLDWLNSLYIRALDLEDFTHRLMPYLQQAGLLTPDSQHKNLTAKNGKEISWEYVRTVAALEKERMKKLSEIGERVAYFFDTPKYDPQILIWKKSNLAQIKESLKQAIGFIESLDEKVFGSQQTLEENIKNFITEKKLDNGSVLWPVRVALSGLEASPGPFEIMAALYVGYGKYEILQRLERALKSLD